LHKSPCSRILLETTVRTSLCVYGYIDGLASRPRMNVESNNDNFSLSSHVEHVAGIAIVRSRRCQEIEALTTIGWTLRCGFKLSVALIVTVTAAALIRYLAELCGSAAYPVVKRTHRSG
jgi:hypothetical protein